MKTQGLNEFTENAVHYQRIWSAPIILWTTIAYWVDRQCEWIERQGNPEGRSGGGTVRTRRRWKAEEKLAIIKETRKGSSVAEVSRKVTDRK